MARKFKRISQCHPERLHMAKGLCGPCYMKKYQSTVGRERHNKRSAEWSAANKIKRRYIHVKYTYGLSKEEYDALFEKYNKSCAICLKSVTFLKAHIDHCHQTNKVRGILCSNCNQALGKLKDDPKVLLKVIHYLIIRETPLKEKYAQLDWN